MSVTDSLFRNQLAAHFHSMARIGREERFGAEVTRCRPINLPIDADTMFAGYVGEKFVPGRGTLFLAINPGGGGDAYVTRTASDEKFYPLLIDFKKSESRDAFEGFERINAAFVAIVATWNLWRILGPAVEASGCDVNEVAYLNLVPYRTRNDKMPPAYARNQSWSRLLKPTVGVLAPRAVIALGKKVDSVVVGYIRGMYPYYCVPRTIGDTYVSTDAENVLDQIRQEICWPKGT